MKTRLAYRLGALILLLGLAGAGRAGELPDLRFVQDSIDFGCVAVDFDIYHTYKLVNHGKRSIKVDTVTAHCDCTHIRFRDSVLQPGDTAEIRMIFNTADFYGRVEKDIRVDCNDPEHPSLHAYYEAIIGQWLFSVEPKPVSVFMLPVKKSKSGRLINHRLDELEVTDLSLDDPSICEVEITKSEAEQGESIEYEVTASPDLVSGEHTTNFTVSLKVPDEDEPLKITIPVKIVRY